TNSGLYKTAAGSCARLALRDRRLEGTERTRDETVLPCNVASACAAYGAARRHCGRSAHCLGRADNGAATQPQRPPAGGRSTILAARCAQCTRCGSALELRCRNVASV